MMKNYPNSFALLLLSMFCTSALVAQNVGIGVATPAHKLHVQANAAADGIRIDNIAANGDPILQYRVNGTARITMGIDDSDADKFKIGSTALTTNTVMTIETNREIGIRTTTPGNMLEMTNGGVNVGANSMANFENQGAAGVALASRNTSTTSGYNAFEGITDYAGTGFIPAGVFGLALYNGAVQAPTIGVRGATNEWQGTGIRGTRFNGGGPDTGFGAEIYDDMGYTGLLLNLSDRRSKRDVQTLSDATNIVNQLTPVQYHYDTDRYPTMGLGDRLEYGFIAQEVQQILPDITKTKRLSTNACEEATVNGQMENKTEEFVMMDYTRLIPILTQAIKEQNTTINQLNDQIKVLQQQVSDLQSGN